MLPRLSIALLILSVPGLARGQEAPERLLPASTQLYLRFDGIEPHRAAFDQTALGKTLKGDSGRFLATLWNDIIDGLGDSLTVPQLLGGAKPEMLKQLQTDAVEAPKLLKTVEQHGLIVAAEVRDILPPQYQVTLIVPGAGAQPAPFLGAVRLALTLTYAETKELTIDGAKVWHWDGGLMQLAWWIDGKDGVVVLSSDKPEEVVKRSRAKGNRITENAQYKKLAEFRQFETLARGYLDGAALVKLAGQNPIAGKLAGELGLDGLKSVRFWSGMEGPASRSLIEIDLPAPRKGLLKLTDVKPFRFGDLPPLPSDMSAVTALRLDSSNVYDATILAVRTAVGLFDPNELKQFDDGVQQLDQVLGLKLREDLLGQLGDLLVVYSSPAEGPLGLGHTFCIRVKDEKKLQKSMEKLFLAFGALSGVKVEVKKRAYRGVDLSEAHFKEQGFFFLPTWTIHDGWLAISYFPQPLHGFILRQKGELPAWKPDEVVQAALAKSPKEITLLSISDPRPSLKSVLTLTPLVGQLLRSFSPDTKFDVSSVPNAHEATRHLFPNVTVGTDDGQTIRIESRSSLALPFEFTGVDTYSFFLLFSFARF